MVDRTQRRRGGRGHSKHDALGAVCFGELTQLGSGQVECFVPADPLPDWVAITLGPGSFQRLDQQVGIDRRVRAPPAPWRRAPFPSGVTDPAQGDEAAILDDGDRPAA